jgi:hypothetical protein
MSANGDYGVFQDEQRHTCIRLKVGKTGVDYVAWSTSALEVAHRSNKEFEQQYTIELTDYPVKQAAQSYLGATWVPVSIAAKKHLTYLAGEKFKEQIPEINFENKESIMTEEAKNAAKATKVAPPKKVSAPSKPAAKKPATKEENQARNNPKLAAEKAAAKAAPKKAEKVAAPAKEKKVTAPKEDPGVTLKKSAKEGDLPPQAMLILDILNKGGKKMQREALLAAYGKEVTSKQTPAALFAFYRGRLIEGGYISVA